MFGRYDAATRYLRCEVQAYSAYWRRSPLPPPPRTLADFAGAGPDLVLRPDPAAIYAHGTRRLAARTAWSRLWGRQERLNDRVLVPRFKPTTWVLADGVPVGYSAADMDRLGRIGSDWLASCRVGRDDVLVSLVAPGPSLDFWALVTAARRARLSALHLGPGADPAGVAALQPTVVAGSPMDLLRALEPFGREKGSISPESRPNGFAADAAAALRPRLVLAVGRPVDDGLRARLSDAAGGAPVRNAWAPPGVRALWGECAGGPEWGLHTDPGSERVELIDPLSGVPVPPGAGGEVVWSPVGWHGTVMLRLRTGVFATVDASPCGGCGRAVPRLLPTAPTPAFLAVLDRHQAVTDWQAELRTVDGAEELIVFLAVSPDADVEGTVRELDRDLSATQYVVLSPDDLDARLAAHGDERLVDLRS